MKNLTTENTKGAGFGLTNICQKSFNKLTTNGNNIKISVYQREIKAYDFKSKFYYAIELNGEGFGHNDMDRDSLIYFIEMIDNYYKSNKRA